MTAEQFYYKTRKNAIGPFKAQTWKLSENIKEEISRALVDQFRKLFGHLGMRDTRAYVNEYIKAAPVEPDLKYYLGEAVTEEEVADLAD